MSRCPAAGRGDRVRVRHGDIAGRSARWPAARRTPGPPRGGAPGSRPKTAGRRAPPRVPSGRASSRRRRARPAPRRSWRADPSHRASRSRPAPPAHRACARGVSAGSAMGTSASAPASPRAARSSRFIRSQAAVCSAASATTASPKTCGCRRVSLSQIASTTSSKANALRFRGKLRVERDLEQQVAELVAQPREVALLDRIRHLVGFLERVRRDGAEILLQVPRAAARGVAQAGHDLEQAINRHRPAAPRASRAASAACPPSRPRC